MAARRLKLYIPDQRAISQAIDAHIDYQRSRFDPLPRDEVGLADRNNQQIGTAYLIFQIPGKAVAGGSTISMQLTKNLFLSSNKSYLRKAEEIATVGARR